MVWKIIVGSLVLVFFVIQIIGVVKDVKKAKTLASKKDDSKVKQPENKKSDKEVK